MGFLNVALIGIVNFSQFIEENQDWDFGILPSFVPSSLNSWEVGIFTPAFIFCQIMKIVFQEGYMCWVGEPKITM